MDSAMSNPLGHEAQPLLEEQDDLPPVYDIIHQIRQDMITYIDTPLNFADLTGAELTYSLVKPLEEKYAKLNNKATVFCFLLNRVYFIRDQSFAFSSLNKTRALLCEILATRTIRQWNHLLELSNILITSWPVYEGCSDEVISKGREIQKDFDPREKFGNAIEMAIISDAKNFVKSKPCQKVIDAIWSGKIVYTAENSRSLIHDAYKKAPIHYYDPRNAPLLDHYRLKIPAIRSVLEYMNFLLLFVLFVIALEFYDPEKINLMEKVFMVYAAGFCLEKLAAMQEHGLRVYIHGTWNGFDVAFIVTFIPYFGLRLYGVIKDEHWARLAGMDCLALAACILFPRLAFVTLSNNLMVLAFRSMFSEFAILMSIAAFCFAGFLYCLWTLSRGTFDYSPGRITWWMLDLYFGLDASGFERASTFHPIFGPALMVIFACLSNTLLLTVLVSILSHTFATISADAEAEARFRRAVATIEGVKADALFSYLPPMNLFAFALMFPASYILSPRWFHKVNVFMIRICAAPVLLAITTYERHTADMPGSTFYDRVSHAAEKLIDSLPRRLRRMTFFEGLAGNGADIDALFQIEDEINQSALDTNDGQSHFGSEYNIPHHSAANLSKRRASSSSHRPIPSFGEGVHVKSDASTTSLDQIRNRRRSGMYGVDITTPVNQHPSPLAQIYHAVVPVEEENSNIDEDTYLGPNSFMPRRRINSMTRPRRPSIEIQQPTMSHPHPAREHMAMPIPPTTVPEHEPITTVTLPGELTRRLVAMEERQQRIENLLVSLAGELRTTGNRSLKTGS